MAKTKHTKGELPFLFVPIPEPILKGPAYRALPDAARSLLLDLLMQFTGGNNGRLTTSFVVMRRYGWTSKSKHERAKAALLEAPFVVRTRIGMPPDTPEWVGVTWFRLNYERSMDIDPRHWPYLNFMTVEAGSVDPNEGREKRFLSPRFGGDSTSPPQWDRPRIRGDELDRTTPIAPESGVILIEE